MNTTERRCDLKEDILLVAQDLFRNYGYDGTTFQKIADILDITKGAITYHFKNKYLIMNHFIQEQFRTIRDFISCYPDEYRNRYWFHCVTYIAIYRIIMKNKRNQDLFFNPKQMGLWETIQIENVCRIYEDIARDFHKDYQREELLITTYMDLGARRRLYYEFLNSNGAWSIDKFCYYHVYLIGCLSKLDETTIKNNINNAFLFLAQHDAPVTEIFQ